MAYADSNPPALIGQKIGGGGQVWFYSSTDPSTDVDGLNYITNAGDLGILAGANLISNDSDTTTTQVIHTVRVTGNGVADLSTGLAITNTDSD